MERLMKFASLLVLALVLLGAGPPSDKPGPAVDKVYFQAFHVDRAALDIQAKSMDLYLFSLKTAAARELAGAAGIRIYEAPASSVSLILNPAEAKAGQLNPFAIKEIRKAVQYLVNRDFIASDIYQGMAVPMVTHVSPLDYDFLTVYDLVRSADIRYDPEYARQVIKEQMQKAGATLVDGVWNYNSRPVRLKFITRVEDERREIGDLIAAELKAAGFQVEPAYRQFAPAVLSVYSTDPASFEWHLYTEGWGRGSPERYDFANINQMAAPWMGNMPGWREVGFWQYENEQLDTLGKKLFTGEFISQDERDQLYRQVTKLALDESVRVWLVTVINSFPAQDTLQGVTEDLVAGPRAPWTLREAYEPGKNELTIGHLWVWTERTTWNPIGGLGDVYSADIWRNLSDPPLWNHPFTGIPQPFRATFDVETAGPRGKLDVPASAVMWDADADQWKAVGSGVRATSKVVYDYSKYFQSTWHHGQPITMADVVYSIAQGYEMAYDKQKSQIETALGVTARPFLATFRGYRLLDGNRLEVYVDFWHFEKSYIASYATPSGLSMPWELLAAMDTLVFDKRQAAYSDTAAARFNVPWISLVMDKDARLVKRVLLELQDQKKAPTGVFQMGTTSLVTQQEALARYQAALDWFQQYGHMVIANGPFFLAKYDPPAQFAELRAFRQEHYPFKPGDWLFGKPPSLTIGRVDPSPAVIGQAFDLPVAVEGPGAIGLTYLLRDPASGSIVASGKASPAAQGLHVTLGAEATGRLTPGLYQLYLLASSDALAIVTERRVDLQVATEAPKAPGAAPAQATATPPAGKTGGFQCGKAPAGSAGLDLSVVAGLLGMVALARRRWR